MPMKQGFLLNCTTPTQEEASGCVTKQQSLGPLQDARIDRQMHGWEKCIRQDHSKSSDPWKSPDCEEGMTFDQLELMRKGTSLSLDEEKIAHNPYQGVPNFPFKTSSVPMNVLGCYYGKHFKKYQTKISENYFSWNDQNPKSHLLLWTSIFLCPIKGEIFVTGSWPMNDPLPAVDSQSVQVIPPYRHEKEQQASVACSINSVRQCRWMKTIKAAKHGAAAWAYDCFQYRNRTSKDTAIAQLVITGPISNEIPYVEQEGIFTVPEFVPQTIRVCIEQRQREIRIEELKRSDDTMNISMKEEMAWCSLTGESSSRNK